MSRLSVRDNRDVSEQMRGKVGALCHTKACVCVCVCVCLCLCACVCVFTQWSVSSDINTSLIHSFCIITLSKSLCSGSSLRYTHFMCIHTVQSTTETHIHTHTHTHTHKHTESKHTHTHATNELCLI